MDFEKVAALFEQIEKASARLEMTDFLAEFLKQIKAEEIDKFIYLAQGLLAPQFEGVNIGMGENFVEGAIARIAGYSKEEVEKIYKQKGDLGIVAEELMKKKKQRALFSEQLTLKKVFENLHKIAAASGTGSQDLKIKLLAELLNSASPLQARYIVRIVMENLRLGIGDPTIMDSLAIVYSKGFVESNRKIVKEIEANLKEKNEEKRKKEFDLRIKIKLREIIEEKYNIHSDLGAIAKTLKEHGLKGLEKIEITPGIPIRPTLAERLPSAEEIIEKLGKCAVEAKYDGFRCISGHTPVYVKRRGLVSVKDVSTGDFVLTHRGFFRKVVAKNKRTIDRHERVYRLQTFFGNEFKVTEKHPMLVYKKSGFTWENIENLSKTDELAFPIPKMKIPLMPKKEMELTDISGYKKNIKLNNEFYRFVGYWIGDGFTNDYHNTERIGIIFNERKEKKLCSLYEKLVKKIFRIQKVSRNTHNGAIYLYWRDPPFKKWLTENFRREWRGKMLPAWFFNISKQNFKQFLKGWIESDGSTDKQGRTSITTKESDLAAFAQLVALKFKVLIGVKKIRVSVKNYIGTYYKLVIAKTQKRARFSGDKLLAKIIKLEEIKRPDPRTIVYNLQIDKDESYCTTMAALHNCQIHKSDDKVWIYSRRQENITAMFPEVTNGTKNQIGAKQAIFEGEALAVNESTGEYFPFQVTIQRKRKYDIAEKAAEFPLKLFAFDLMFLNGKNLMGAAFKDRRAALEKITKKGPVIELTKSIVTGSAKEMNKFFEDNISKGLEGIIAKDLNARYIAGARKFAWIKLKRSYKGELSDSVDAVIIGYFKGRGQRTVFGLGALLTAVYDEKEDMFKSIAKIGTGMSEQMLKELEKMLSKIKRASKPARVDSELEADVWCEPRYVIEVRADEITKSPIHTAGKEKGKEEGFALRFPRLIKLRADRKPEETTTVKEIIEMYKNQRKVSTGEEGA